VQVGGDEAAVVVRVDDSGPGIPVAERSRVFDRFYRRAGSETTGSGLGLAIVRAIAERHGAEVRLDDSPLGGLRVELRLPRRRPG
jgi:signal transduction histidine kinase